MPLASWRPGVSLADYIYAADTAHPTGVGVDVKTEDPPSARGATAWR